MREELSQDDILFDRLVDGELSVAERRRLLASLDDRPDGWRRCALGFLESQCWTEELGQFVRSTADASMPDQPDEKSVLASPVPPHNTGVKRGVAWLAIAASLLVAFTLGSISRDGARIAGGVVPNPDAQLAETVPPPALGDAAKAEDALTLWVRDETGQARPLRVPLVDAGTLDQQLGLHFQTGLPAGVRSQLQVRGFDVQSKRRYAPLWLENGRPMIVPVEDTRIVPVSRNTL